MCESKMRRMQPDLEHKRIAEDSQIRICLPALRGKEDKGKKGSMPEKVITDLCRSLNDMEKEHSAKSQSAQNDYPYCNMPCIMNQPKNTIWEVNLHE